MPTTYSLELIYNDIYTYFSGVVAIVCPAIDETCYNIPLKSYGLRSLFFSRRKRLVAKLPTFSDIFLVHQTFFSF